MDDKMMNYLFMDADTGEEFYVRTDNKRDAIAKAKTITSYPEYVRADPDSIADLYGYDTY